MATKQHYKIAVRQLPDLTHREIRGNEQSIQAFTQVPPSHQAGDKAEEGLAAHDLFFLFTARVIMEKKVFTR